jgi:hypothetical protein
VNVEVLQGSSTLLPTKMKLGERSQLGKGIVINFTTELTNTAQQCLSRGAKRPVLPARVLFAGFALPSLQDPLQRIVHDPPILVKLRCKPI